MTRKNLVLARLAILCLLFYSCHKESSPPNNPPPPPPPPGGTVVVPTVSTTAVSGITVSAATTGGNISSDGGGAVTSRGVCWGTSPNPVVTGSHTTDGTGTGNFASAISGLNAFTTYYVRAYATNSAGTAYGNELSFQTLNNPPPPANSDTAATLFIGSPYSYKFYAINASNGAIKWTVTLGGLIFSSPIYANGRVYIGCGDNKLYCYDTLGNSLWTQSTGTVYATSPVVANGTVFFPDQQGLSAFNAATGALLWRSTNGGKYIVVKNNVVYTNNGNCYALDAATGNVLWQYPTGSGVMPVVLNDRLYVHNNTLRDSMVVLRLDNGNRIWGIADGGVFESPLNMSVRNGRVYCIAETDANNATNGTNGLNILDSANGSRLYPTTRFTLTTIMADGIAPVFADGVMFIGTETDVSAYDPLTGLLLYQIPYPGGGGPTVVGDIVYFTSRKTTVYPPNQNPYDAGFVLAYNYKTRNFVWIREIVNMDFVIAAPCVQTKSGKCIRGNNSY